MLARSSKVITLHVKERIHRVRRGGEVRRPLAEGDVEVKAAQLHTHMKPARSIRPTS